MLTVIMTLVYSIHSKQLTWSPPTTISIALEVAFAVVAKSQIAFAPVSQCGRFSNLLRLNHWEELCAPVCGSMLRY